MNIDEIKYKMKYIEKLTKDLGDKLDSNDYYIEDMGCPHIKPSKLPPLYSAIYIFLYESDNEYEFLKIGKANAKSSARFTSQHYGFSAKSTLAKSLCHDKKFIALGVTEENVCEFILNNVRRVNIYIKENKAMTELVEAVLHYSYRPRYEGNI